ncbi:MAG: hypothetical protein QNJ44_21685 [Rhodobacter sp.]|nr:hypothetical protein [Rhodobacter sp.]
MTPLRACCPLPVIAAALLVGNAAAAQGFASEEEKAVHVATLSLFHAICLQTLPGFEEADERFAKAGLGLTDDGFWTDDDRGLVARVAHGDNGRQRGCFMGLRDANLAALDLALGPLVGDALPGEEVGRMRGPMPGDPSLYIIERDGYRITTVAASVSRGYVMLSVGVDVPEGIAPPWGAE